MGDGWVESGCEGLARVVVRKVGWFLIMAYIFLSLGWQVVVTGGENRLERDTQTGLEQRMS